VRTQKPSRVTHCTVSGRGFRPPGPQTPPASLQLVRQSPKYCVTVVVMPTTTTAPAAADRPDRPDRPDQLDLAFQALADSSRRAMVIRLTRGPASVSELAAPLKMSMPSVMQHIDVLQRSGLVHSQKVGRVRICRLEPAPMQTLERWIAEHRAAWERSFDRLGQVLDEVFPDEQGDSSQK